MQRRTISQPPQSFSHLGENQFRFIAERKKCLSAAKLFARARHIQHFIPRHRMRSRLARVATERAISAIVATQVCERNKNFAGVSNYAGLEAIAGLTRCSEQFGQFVVAGTNPAACVLAREWRIE